MPIKIRTTYALITPESAEHGGYKETGWIDQEGIEYTFSELVDLLGGCEMGSHHLLSCWATDHAFNLGSRDYYETGIVEERSYHPVNERDSRYFIKACKFAGIL